jgi:hypothetical protein
MQIYRNFEIGKLIKLIMLDTRVIGEHGTLCFAEERCWPCILHMEHWCVQLLVSSLLCLPEFSCCLQAAICRTPPMPA